jgi:hypothetical protein
MFGDALDDTDLDRPPVPPDQWGELDRGGAPVVAAAFWFFLGALGVGAVFVFLLASGKL